MTNYTKAAFFLMFLGFPVSLYGAKDTPRPNKNEPAKQVAGEKQPEKKKSDTVKSSNKDQTFKPTEKISEDLSVSFPVDI